MLKHQNLLHIFLEVRQYQYKLLIHLLHFFAIIELIRLQNYEISHLMNIFVYEKINFFLTIINFNYFLSIYKNKLSK